MLFVMQMMRLVPGVFVRLVAMLFVMLMLFVMKLMVKLLAGVLRLELFQLGTPLSPGRLRHRRQQLWPVAILVYQPRCCWPT